MGRILVVDDNRDLCAMLKSLLEGAGYSVAVAADGREALSIQRDAPADVLITDLFMPESDGFETIEGFRKTNPKMRIVVISGDSKLTRRDYLATAALIGVDATLRKPFDTEALLETLRSFAKND